MRLPSLVLAECHRPSLLIDPREAWNTRFVSPQHPSTLCFSFNFSPQPRGYLADSLHRHVIKNPTSFHVNWRQQLAARRVPKKIGLQYICRCGNHCPNRSEKNLLRKNHPAEKNMQPKGGNYQPHLPSLRTHSWHPKSYNEEVLPSEKAPPK